MSHTKPIVLSTVAEMRDLQKTWSGRVGFVPTMGALHAGHSTLLSRSREENEISVLSIFVNPTQFGPNEDLAKYPRTLERDLSIAGAEGVDYVFAPTPDEIYPNGYSTYTEEQTLSAPLCGKFRPGHFRGVTTVVQKLFNIVQPEHAYFGLKDAQQFFVLHKMCRDLNLPVKMVGVATIRENDGLALSSRNVYLTPQQRERAPLLYKTLSETRDQILRTHGENEESLLRSAVKNLEDAGFQVQYLEHLGLPNFTAVEPLKPSLLAVAVYLGTTRLIDNVILHQSGLPAFGIRTLD